MWFLWNRVPSPQGRRGGRACKHSLCGPRGAAAAERPWPLLLACLRLFSWRGARERWKEVVGVCARSLVSVLMHRAQVPSWASWGCAGLKMCTFHTGCPSEPATGFMWGQLRGKPARPSLLPENWLCETWKVPRACWAHSCLPESRTSPALRKAEALLILNGGLNVGVQAAELLCRIGEQTGRLNTQRGAPRGSCRGLWPSAPCAPP